MSTTYDFRILLETISGSTFSYGTPSFVNTTTDTILTTSQSAAIIDTMPSMSFYNGKTFTTSSALFDAVSGKFSDTDLDGDDHQFLSCSIVGHPLSGSLKFTINDEMTTTGDFLKRYKFFGNKVCNVFGVPENYWIYSDAFRLTNKSGEQNYLSGDVLAQSINIKNNFAISNAGSVETDIPFKHAKDSDRWLKWVDVSGSVATNDMLIGYSNQNDRYEIRMKNDDHLLISASFLTASGDMIVNNDITSSGLQLGGKTIKTTGIQRDQVLKFNGTEFVAADADATFVFTISDFDVSNLASQDIQIGTGLFKGGGALNFTATYVNGPPDGNAGSAEGAPTIEVLVNDIISSSTNLPMKPLSSSFSTGTNSSAIAFPNTVGHTIKFALSASAGSDKDIELSDQTYTFRNVLVHGSGSVNSSFNQSIVRELEEQNSIITNDTTRTITQNIDNGDFLNFAHRSGDTQINQVRCGTGNNILTVAMNRTNNTTITPTRVTVNYENTKGFTEDFKVYASTLANDQDGSFRGHSNSFTLVTTTIAKNYIYWGARDSGTTNETLVEGLDNKNSSIDDNNIINQTLTVGTFTNKHVYVAIPNRYGDNGTDYVLKDNGTNLPDDLVKHHDVTVTNVVGFEEDYSVYKSTNALTFDTSFTILIDSV